MNLDELEAELDRLDKADATKLSPIEFARLVGIAPQLVYYYIRNKQIETEWCVCGRRVVDVASATKVIQAKKEARGRDMARIHQARTEGASASEGPGPTVS